MDITNSNKEIYNAIEFEEYFKHRMNKILPHLQTIQNPSVVDLGCGAGQFFDALQYSGLKVDDYTGVDIGNINLLKAKEKGIKTVETDLSKELPFEDNKFDVVIATEIIEHLYDTFGFLQECNRILKKGGILVLTTPNIASLGNRIMMMFFGKRPGAIDYRKEKGPGHIRAFVKNELESLIEEADFEIKSSVGKEVNLPFFNTKNKNINGLNEIICKAFPTISTGFIVIGVKK